MSKRHAETHSEEPPAEAQHTRAESSLEWLRRQIHERDTKIGMTLDPCLRNIRVQGKTQNENGQEVIENRDFLPYVPRHYLGVSDLLSAKKQVDRVIKMDDSIEAVKPFVDWMLRDMGFRFTRENIFPLPKLVGKYQINRLHQDIENYSFRLIREYENRAASNTGERHQKSCTEKDFNLWKLAAVYDLSDLEKFLRKYCLERIYEQLGGEDGLESILFKEDMPAEIVGEIVREAVNVARANLSRQSVE